MNVCCGAGLTSMHYNAAGPEVRPEATCAAPLWDRVSISGPHRAAVRVTALSEVLCQLQILRLWSGRVPAGPLDGKPTAERRRRSFGRVA